jgi:hypothetical protein
MSVAKEKVKTIHELNATRTSWLGLKPLHLTTFFLSNGMDINNRILSSHETKLRAEKELPLPPWIDLRSPQHSATHSKTALESNKTRITCHKRGKKGHHASER